MNERQFDTVWVEAEESVNILLMEFLTDWRGKRATRGQDPEEDGAYTEAAGTAPPEGPPAAPGII